MMSNSLTVIVAGVTVAVVHHLQTFTICNLASFEILNIGFDLQLLLLLLNDFPGGAIFDKLNRFENSVGNAAAALLLLRLLLGIPLTLLLLLPVNRLPAIEWTFDASNEAICDLPLAVGKILMPCTRFTCRVMPSGAIM